MDDATAMYLEDCAVAESTLGLCLEQLSAFAARYAPYYQRREHRELSELYLQGLLADVDRKSVEPIANFHGRARRGLQRFVGAGKWDDDRIRQEFRKHVAEELGDPQGVLIIDPSTFVKRGRHSVGVARQYCGRLGKRENCQKGVYLSYSSPRGHTLVSSELYLPEEWAKDSTRRTKCHVPEELEFRTSWQIADDWLLAHAHEFPHAWIVGDEELGKSGGFRKQLRRRKERYLLSIQGRRTIRVVNSRYPKGRKAGGHGRRRLPAFEQAQKWAEKLPLSAWKRVWVRDGEKGPIEVYALQRKVQTKSDNRIDAVEKLLVIRTIGPRPEYRFWLSNDQERTPLEELVRVAAERHRIEEDFQRGKGEVGMADYEVRSWVGFRHHMTMVLLALFFLVLEKRRLG